MKPSSHKPSRSVAREVRKILREHTVYARSDVAGRQFGRIAAELLEGFKLPVDADIEVGEFRVRRPSISDVFVVDRLGSHALQRYGEPDRVSTRRDPFEDLCAWTKGLRSHDYTGYLLRKYHSLRAAREIREAARAIGVHAEAAVDLIDQAKCGPPEISYLPYYYALLNLAKIYVVARGRGSALSTNKSHGAGYDRQANVQGALAAEWIEIRSKGSIPLF